MLVASYYPDYYSLNDILVLEETVKCTVTSTLMDLGFLDSSSGDIHLEVGKTVNLPLWYITKVIRIDSCYKIEVPEVYKNIYKAVCEAETTHIDLGKLHASYYEYGRYLAPYDMSNMLGNIVVKTICQRIIYLLEMSKITVEDAKPDHKLELIESILYNVGMKTNIAYTHWLQLRPTKIYTNDLIQEYQRKKERIVYE